MNKQHMLQKSAQGCKSARPVYKNRDAGRLEASAQRLGKLLFRNRTFHRSSRRFISGYGIDPTAALTVKWILAWMAPPLTRKLAPENKKRMQRQQTDLNDARFDSHATRG